MLVSARTSSVPRAPRSRRLGSRPWGRLPEYRSLQPRSQYPNLCVTGEQQDTSYWEQGEEEEEHSRSAQLYATSEPSMLA
jgi:hypothetical protein